VTFVWLKALRRQGAKDAKKGKKLFNGEAERNNGKEKNKNLLVLYRKPGSDFSAVLPRCVSESLR